MKKSVVIDASSAMTFPGQYLSGIGRVTLELIRAIEEISDPELDILLFCQRLSSDRLQKYNFKSKTITLPFPRWPTFDWIRNKTPTLEILTGADLLHIPHIYSPVYRPEKTVVTIHDAMFLTFPETHLHTKKMIKKTISLARRCKAIITISKFSKKDLVDYAQIPPEKINVCYCGYNANNFYHIEDRERVLQALQSTFNIETPYFFSVSCDIGRKNSPAVVEQFLKLAAEGTEHHLVMVWRNPPADVLRLVDSSNFGSRVHFLKGVSDDDLRLLYNGATALLFPSKYEGFGLPVLEALACGTPVVTCNVSSLPEVGGDAAIYIEPGDNEALLDVMRKFEQGVYSRDAMQSACLCQAEKFSWECCARQTLDVYRKCLELT